jgi:cellulose synthase/poly-beta-1,6-N-acetylglucosamine synthase-like glycosyltransferase
VTVAAILLAGLFGGLWLLLLAASLHLLRLGLWGLLTPLARETAAAPASFAELPFVTVQIPLRNERFVARRALLASASLDWPADRIEIQVLDDSDDDTRQIVDSAAAELVAAGRAVTVLRRTQRSGYKAGALDDALPQARGEFIAILDADFVPPTDFLRRLIGHFRDAPRLAFVQGRWSFLNEEENLLTRLQALILHGLMLVEQPYLTAHGRPIQFNGTGGVWRKRVLLEASGFRGGGSASVTEDMDLSYRACLLGYHGKQLPEVAVPTELPATMAAFRVQQQRWVRGGAQVLRSLFLKLHDGRLSSGERLTLLGHLLRHARQPYLSLCLIWLPLLLVGVRPTVAPPGGLAAALGLLVLSLLVYYGAALRRLSRSPRRALFLAPLLVPLSMGLSLSLSAALLSGLFLGRGTAEFVRTPKSGEKRDQKTAAPPLYKPRRDRLARLETGLGILYAVLSGLALSRSDVRLGLGLGLIVACGLLWVGLGTLAAWRSPRM